MLLLILQFALKKYFRGHTDLNHGPIGLQPIALPLSYTPWLRKLPRQLQSLVQLTNWTGPSKCTADKAACNCKGHRKCCYFLLRNILSIKICCTKKARRDSWDLGRKMHSQTVMSRVIWFCEAVAKLFFYFCDGGNFSWTERCLGGLIAPTFMVGTPLFLW